MKTFKAKILLNFLAASIACFAFFSCQKDSFAPDWSSEIEGNFTINSYVTQAGVSKVGESNVLEIKRVDNTHVTLTVQYLDVVDDNAENLVFSNMRVQKIDSQFDLSQLFSNAKAGAELNQEQIHLRVKYTNGDFLEIKAHKK